MKGFAAVWRSFSHEDASFPGLTLELEQAAGPAGSSWVQPPLHLGALEFLHSRAALV